MKNFFVKKIISRLLMKKPPLFIEQNENKRKRQRSSDDAALNYFKQSPGHHMDRKFQNFTSLLKIFIHIGH